MDGNLTFEHQLHLSLFSAHFMLDFSMASQGVEGRWAQTKGSLQEFNSGQNFILAFHHACALELCFFLESDLRKHHKLSR